ncbi:MAG TPA: class I SAM-dependent methyltransferase [Candidatus Nanoarchaeia archaeon]|nr:class I SAM-dependent methyltransferase [Candidatus Nanoarchaeia archaeon]
MGKSHLYILKNYYPLLKKRKIIKILDFGCGNGRNSFFLKSKGFDVFAIDSEPVISKSKMEFIKSNIPFKSYTLNSTKIPYEKESFEGIIAWRVLHRGFKKYRQRLLKELYRILKKMAI